MTRHTEYITRLSWNAVLSICLSACKVNYQERSIYFEVPFKTILNEANFIGCKQILTNGHSVSNETS